MRRVIMTLSLAVSILGANAANAQMAQPMVAAPTPTNYGSSRGHGIGVGAVAMLNGPAGGLFTWSAPQFHIDGFMGLHRYKNGGDTTDFFIGGRGWYHLHSASFADFSVGGGLGFLSWTENPGAQNSNGKIDVIIEIGTQIRAFIVPNVALIGDVGLGFNLGNHGRSDDIVLGGDLLSSLGIAYFFE